MCGGFYCLCRFLQIRNRKFLECSLTVHTFVSYELQNQNILFSGQFANVLFAKLRQQICEVSVYSPYEITISVGGASSKERSVPWQSLSTSLLHSASCIRTLKTTHHPSIVEISLSWIFLAQGKGWNWKHRSGALTLGRHSRKGCKGSSFQVTDDYE